MIFAGRAMPDRVGRVIIAASKRHGVTPGEVLGRSKLKRIYVPRQDAMQRLAKAGYSSTAIGFWFDRHHTSVLHAMRRTAKSRERAA